MELGPQMSDRATNSEMRRFGFMGFGRDGIWWGEAFLLAD